MNTLKHKTRILLPVLLCIYAMFFSSSVFAIKSVSVYALFKGKAILLIDGNKQMLKAGETSEEGLTLVSSTTKRAVIKINGKEEVLGLDINPTTEAMSIGSANNVSIGETVTLSMGNSGFFHAQGEINGNAVTFLVDTGANSVAMSMSTARSLGIDYESGRKSISSTANGNVRTYIVTLEKVSVESIEVDNVVASIIQDPGPSEILLGMSFLSNLEMKRVGSTMELIQR
ncbi:MAG: TIGR02281 family clan AA aspartic protease [Gammaproteobacteria bacterium]|nr:TIGR02281 family clan AA aspartic protease [Gammaproteobacteria bacterium]